MIIKENLKGNCDDYHQHFNANKQAQLQDIIFIEKCMNWTLQKGPNSIQYDHQGIGCGKSIHVGQKVSSKLFIGRIVDGVTWKSTKCWEKEHYYCKDQQPLWTMIKAKGYCESSKAQESEKLNIILDCELKDDSFKGIRSE